jgi:ribosomal protein S2
MKLNKIKIKKYKLLRFYLVKYEIYEKVVGSSDFIFPETVLDELEFSFKKVLLIIYKYHIYNKKILFVGFPYSTNKKLLSVMLKSNHIFIPRGIWVKGMLSNKSSILKKYKNYSYYKDFLQLKTNPHLIVFFNDTNSDNLLLESCKLHIPLISFGKVNKRFQDVFYEVKGRFFTRKSKNFYQFLIYSILKRPKYSDKR